MTITSNDLRGRNRFEFEGLPHMSLHLRRNIRVRSDRSRQLHHGNRITSGTKSIAISVKLQRPQRNLRPKRCRLCMNTMGSTDHHRFTVGLRSRHELINELINCRQQQIGGVTHRPAQRSIDNIGRCQTVMNPRSSGAADRLLHNVDKRSDVVLGDFFASHNRCQETLIDGRGG